MPLFDILQHNPVLYLTAVFVFGLLVGSFLNVVILRLPVMLKARWKLDCIGYLSETESDLLATTEPDKSHTKEPGKAAVPEFNLLTPRSRCPKCGHMIKAWENIPLISYLFLRGRCTECNTPISIRYPSIEFLSGLMALIAAWQFGVSTAALAVILLSWALITLTFIDFDHQYLPDDIVLPFMWFGLLLNTQGVFTDLGSAVIGAAVGYLLLWSVYQLFKLLTGKEGMGYGDFKLLALFGAWLGWQMLPAVILISSVVGSIVGISLILFRRHKKEIPIPFGPYLAAAGWIALMWGAQINNAYLDWLSR